MDFAALILGGIALGCVYALMASSVVLTFKTTGVFNLGLGAQAYVCAAVFYTLASDLGWPTIPALIVAVVILGPLLGLGLYWGLFRYAQKASETVRLVVGLGILLLLPAIVQAAFFGAGLKGDPPVTVPGTDSVFEIFGLRIGGDRLTTVIITIVLVGALAALFRYTTLGLRMRAVVESPRMVQLAGIDAGWISSVSWMLSGFVAGLAGAMLAPLFGSVDIANYIVLLVAAIAAAVVGRLSSLPLTLLGGLLLGLCQVIINRYLPADSVFATGLKASLPFILLFGLLVFVPKFRTLGGVSDPLSGVDPPLKSQRAPAQSTRSEAARNKAGLSLVISAAIVVILSLIFSDVWLFRFSTAVIFGVIFLSFTVLTGMAGQLSLGQAAFAGLGAFMAAQLAFRWNFPIFWGIVCGAIFAAIIGALLALPLRRLRGIYLTLATLAFGLLIDQIVFPLDAVGGGPAGLEVARPYQSGILDFSGDRMFFYLVCIVFGIVAWIVWRMREGTTGQMLDATRGSETGAASVGIDPGRAKIVAFALASAIAGLGGGLLVSLQQRATAADFGIGMSLLWPLAVIVLGARSIVAALVAGIMLVILPEILRLAGVPDPILWVTIGFGLGAFMFVKRQEGQIEALARGTRELYAKLRRRGDDEPGRGSHGDRGDLGPAKVVQAPPGSGLYVAADFAGDQQADPQARQQARSGPAAEPAPPGPGQPGGPAADTLVTDMPPPVAPPGYESPQDPHAAAPVPPQAPAATTTAPAPPSVFTSHEDADSTERWRKPAAGERAPEEDER